MYMYVRESIFPDISEQIRKRKIHSAFLIKYLIAVAYPLKRSSNNFLGHEAKASYSCFPP